MHSSCIMAAETKRHPCRGAKAELTMIDALVLHQDPSRLGSNCFSTLLCSYWSAAPALDISLKALLLTLA